MNTTTYACHRGETATIQDDTPTHGTEGRRLGAARPLNGPTSAAHYPVLHSSGWFTTGLSMVASQGACAADLRPGWGGGELVIGKRTEQTRNQGFAHWNSLPFMRCSTDHILKMSGTSPHNVCFFDISLPFLSLVMDIRMAVEWYSRFDLPSLQPLTCPPFPSRYLLPLSSLRRYVSARRVTEARIEIDHLPRPCTLDPCPGRPTLSSSALLGFLSPSAESFAETGAQSEGSHAVRTGRLGQNYDDRDNRLRGTSYTRRIEPCPTTHLGCA